MNTRDKMQRLLELGEDVSQILKRMKKLDGVHAESPKALEVVRGCRMVLGAAWVELYSLLGMDVDKLEADLDSRGWPTWNALWIDSSDSETVEPAGGEVTQQAVAQAELPQVKFFKDADARLYVGFPLPALPNRGEEVQS